MARRPTSDIEQRDADLLFEFCVDGIAVSAQSKKRDRLRAWKDRVAARARMAATGSVVLAGPIKVRLSEFSELRSKDRDNFAKPILDAMQGILFQNDRQVELLESDWRYIDGRFKVRHMSKVVADALVAGHEFIWIRIYRHRPRETLIP